MSVVDGHVHLAAALPQREGAEDTAWPFDWPAGHSLTVDAYLDMMATSGIDRAVLATSTRRDMFDNEFTAASVAADPARFVGVGAMDVLAPDAAATFSYWVHERGLRGMRLFGGHHTDADSWITDDRVAEVLRRAADAGAMVSLQRTRLSTCAQLPAIAGRYPEVSFVVYSAASPPVWNGSVRADPLLRLGAVPNIFVSLSMENVRANADPRTGRSPFLDALSDAFGAHRLMWGSYSMMYGARSADPDQTLHRILDEFRAGFDLLDAEGLDSVLGGTAQTVFRMPGRVASGL